MSSCFIKLVKYLTISCIIIWVIVAFIVFGLWKNLYYYPQYNLYIYADGGFVNNRTLLLGEDTDSLNTILRYDSKDEFCCYIAKTEGHYYIYWPEDTASYQCNSIKKQVSSESFSYEMKEVHYDAHLKEYFSTDTLFSLVTYVHLTPENWIDNYKTYSDTLHWWVPGQLKVDYALGLSSMNTKENVEIRCISVFDCGLLTYMKIVLKAMDSKTIAFILVLIFWIMLYCLLNIIEHRNSQSFHTLSV